MAPNNYDDSPPVTISSEGVFLVFKDRIDAIQGLTKRNEIEAAAQSWAESNTNQILNYDTKILETKFKTRTYEWDDGGQTEIVYLFPREWYYFFCVENPTDQVNLHFINYTKCVNCIVDLS